MGRKRDDQVEESLISVRDAAVILEISENEVAKLISEQKLNAFQLGSDLVRLRKDQVWEYQSKARISAELFPDDRQMHHNAPVKVKVSTFERIRDFLYFNDFYIISFGMIAALLYLILSSQNI